MPEQGLHLLGLERTAIQGIDDFPLQLGGDFLPLKTQVGSVTQRPAGLVKLCLGGVKGLLWRFQD